MLNSLSNLLNSISDLIAPLFKFLVWIFPIKIYRLHDGERGVIKTYGKVRKWREAERGPGVIICFIFEEMEIVQSIGGFVNLDEQMIMTLDKKLTTINGMVIYDVVNVQSAILENEDIDEFVRGFCMNAIREYSNKHLLKDIIDSEKLSSELSSIVNYKLKKRGVKIREFMVTDLRPHEVTLICDTIRDIFKSS